MSFIESGSAQAVGEFVLYGIWVLGLARSAYRSEPAKGYVELSLGSRFNCFLLLGVAAFADSLVITGILVLMGVVGLALLELDVPILRSWRPSRWVEMARTRAPGVRSRLLSALFFLTSMVNGFFLASAKEPIFAPLLIAIVLGITAIIALTTWLIRKRRFPTTNV